MTATGSSPAPSTPIEIGAISAEQARLVLDVSRMLAVTTDLDALLRKIAEATCLLLNCERSSIFLHDPDTGELWSKVALGSGEIRVPATAGIVGHAFTDNRILGVPSPYDDPRFNREVDKRTGFVTRNILAAPMSDLSRKPLGVVQAINKKVASGQLPAASEEKEGASPLVTGHSPLSTDSSGFGPADAALMQMLADQAGVAIQRYRLQLTAIQAAAMRHEMDLARRVQDAMLPKKMPDVQGVEAMGWTRAASVTGGDCFDLWRTHDGRLGILLADASGHGLAPTLVVSQVRTLIRAFAEVDPHPRRLLERANVRLAEDLESERFVTAFLAFLAPDGTLEWCSAGHGPILIRSSADAAITELVPSELPLGVMPELTGEPVPPLLLSPGGLLAVVSDGIFEAMTPSGAGAGAGEQLGTPRVVQLLDASRSCSPQEIIQALRDAATQWTGLEEPKDDQTIVIARRRAVPVP